MHETDDFNKLGFRALATIEVFRAFRRSWQKRAKLTYRAIAAFSWKWNGI